MKLKFQDKAYLLVESENTPMHVFGFNIFKYSPGCNREKVLQSFIENLKIIVSNNHPYNQVIDKEAQGFFSKQWKTISKINTDEHIHVLSLNKTRDDQELHSVLDKVAPIRLDLTKPPWTIHIIDNYQEDLFAVCFKLHHSLVDGLSIVKLGNATMEALANGSYYDIFPQNKKKKTSNAPSISKRVKLISEVSSEFFKIASNPILKCWDNLPEWFQSKNSPLNQRIGSQRVYDFLSFNLVEFKQIANHHGATINDLLLCICSGALRRYFKEQKITYHQNLKVSVPSSLPLKNQLGNAFSLLIFNLENQEADPIQRLKKISSHTNKAKERLSNMSRKAILLVNLLCYLPFLLSQVFHLKNWLALPFNLTISNLKGPDDLLQCDGIEMVSTFAFSCLYNRTGLNITVLSYQDSLNIGIIACKENLPAMQNLSHHIQEEYEQIKDLSQV